MIKIERAAIDLFGGAEAFDAAIFTFGEALKKHAKTKGQAAPTAHPVVERIVRENGGKYEVIEPVEIVTSIPEKTLEEAQTAAFEEIKYQRRMAAESGVVLNGVTFSSSMDSLTALIAADIEAEGVENWRNRWKVGAGNFVLVTRSDVQFLITAIRIKHQKLFGVEMELSDRVGAAITVEQVAAIDLTKGWDI